MPYSTSEPAGKGYMTRFMLYANVLAALALLAMVLWIGHLMP